MAYQGLNIDDTVQNCNKYSHTIPAYPEVTSSTVFDDSFYLERRQECKRLIGGNVDYHTLSTECPTGIEDIQVGGKTEISIGETFFYTLEGEDNDTYVDNYHIVWSRPYGQMSIWGYESDTVDVITVQVAG